MHLPDHRLAEEPRHLTEAAAERHEPLIVAWRSPVRCEDRRRREEPDMLEVPRYEVLRQKLDYSGRPWFPAKDQMLFARNPMVQCFG